jgi:hypothetical protein
MDYTVEATAVGATPVSTTVTTGIPPFNVGTWLTMTGTSTMGLVGLEAPCTTDPIAVIYDTDTGDLVWYRLLDDQGTIGPQDMYRFTDDQTVLADSNFAVVEVDLLGTEIVDFTTAFDIHHDLFRRDDLIYVLDKETVGGLTLDDVVIFDTTGVETARWKSEDHLSIPVGATGDLLHTNSIFVDEAGDMYLSMMHQNSIAKIEGDLASPDFGTPLWILPGDVTQNTIGHDIVVDWSPIGGADTFDTEHHIHLRHDGRLMVLDNDHGRALVFSVDEVNLTATMEAEYATFEASCGRGQGTAIDLLNGNSVVACNTGMVREYDLATGLEIWEAEVGCRNGSVVGQGVTAARWYPLDGWE